MKVILHIGAEKTGTSSIQEFLLQNKSDLIGQGYFYLHMDGRNEYRDFPAYCMDEGKYDAYFRRINVRNPELREVFNQSFIKEYKNKIRSIPNDVHTVILSSEHFRSRLHTMNEVTRVKRLLSEDLSEISIVLYIRNQVLKVCSSYSTRIKSGGTNTFDDHLNNYLLSSRDDYNQRLLFWEGVFGKDNIRLRLFDRNEFIGGSLLEDFVSIFDQKLFNKMRIPVAVHNESLSGMGCEVLRRINYLFPESIRGYQSVENFRFFLIRLVSKCFKGNPVKLTDQQGSMIEKKFSKSNNEICRKYFPGRKALF